MPVRILDMMYTVQFGIRKPFIPRKLIIAESLNIYSWKNIHLI